MVIAKCVVYVFVVVVERVFTLVAENAGKMKYLYSSLNDYLKLNSDLEVSNFERKI